MTATMPYSYGDPSLFSRKAVRKAGERTAEDRGTALDAEIIANWRNSHAYVLTTFQNSLRRHIGDAPIVLAQRLKRLNTIVDKLKTGRAKDLSTMHDLAGCRLIFDSVDDLRTFRSRFHLSRAKHQRIHADKYDYIDLPKETGYRGVHDVFQYRVNDDSTGSLYNGLRIEIQYRTKAQHAWATAVEISDIIDGHRIKFDRGANVRRERLFVLASEYIARTKENVFGCCPELTDLELVTEMKDLERDLHIIANLAAVRKSDVEIPRQRNIVLHFSLHGLRAYGWGESKGALVFRDMIEKGHPEDDVVYVSAANQAAIANAFRNYFKDAADFVDMVSPALK